MVPAIYDNQSAEASDVAQPSVSPVGELPPGSSVRVLGPLVLDLHAARHASVDHHVPFTVPARV